MWLGFHNAAPDEYLEIVRSYAAHHKLKVGREELVREALQWLITHGSHSGRVAWQFVQYLAGRLGHKLKRERGEWRRLRTDGAFSSSASSAAIAERRARPARIARKAPPGIRLLRPLALDLLLRIARLRCIVVPFRAALGFFLLRIERPR